MKIWPTALIRLGTVARFYAFCGTLIPWAVVGAILSLLYGGVAGLYLAPADYQQGDAFRIIYVHVPCAILSLGLYMGMAIASFIYLVWRIKVADIVAYSMAPIGAFFTVSALVTGALWGKPMWGTWWIWDARLTSELILLFLYVGYIGLYQAIPSRKMAAKLAAILAVVGAIDIPIIHYSVYWWNTLHQGATLFRWGRPTIDLTMLYPLIAMIIGLGLYALFLVSLRARAEILVREIENQRLITRE